MSLATTIILLIFGLFLVIKGADIFIEGSGCLAKKFKIPQIIIGLTVVAIGTSAPEAAVSITSSINGSDGIAIGNVLGSNIANILMILGLTSTFCTLHFKENTIKFEIPFLIFCTGLLCLMGFYFGEITRLCATVLLILFGIFIYYLFKIAKKEDFKEPCPCKISNFKILLYILGGIIALVWGSDLTVNNSCIIAKTLGVTERTIGLTIIAFGTCLPEFATCLISAIKKQSDLAIGNIIGSLNFNLLFALGAACFIMPVQFQNKFLFDGAIALLSTILLLIFTYKNKSLNKIQGAVMTVLYLIYLGSLFI